MEIPAGSKFCNNCGNPVSTTDNTSIENPNVAQATNQYQQAGNNGTNYQPYPYATNNSNPYNANVNYQQPPQKKKKGKGCLISVIAVVGVFLFLGLISSLSGNNSSSNNKKVTPSSSNQSQNDSNQSVNDTVDAVDNANNISTEIAESLLYDSNNVKIYVKGIQKNTVFFYIENNADANYTFRVTSCAINNLMTNDNISFSWCDVAAKSKANTELKIKNSFLEYLSITDIYTIDISFYAYDDENWSDNFDTGKLRIKTNKTTDEKTVITGKETVFDANSIKIEYVQRDINNFVFCLTNSTDSIITFTIENITINGYTNSKTDYDLYSEEVLNGSQFIFTIKADNNFLYKNGIDSITNLQFNTKIYNKGTYSDNWSTGNVSIEIE